MDTPAPPELPAPMQAPHGALRAIGATVATTIVVTLVSRFAPDRYAATAVGVAFLAAVWLLVLRADEETIRWHGLALGGVLEPTRIDARRLARDAAVALAYVLPLMALIYPPFWLGFRLYWHTHGAFHLVRPPSLLDDVAGQFVVIALPEEAFFRGYLQSELDRVWPPRWRILGAELGPGCVVAAAFFAVGHVLTVPNPGRLAVFFPALVFAWLRARTGGIGAGVVFHASCNLFAETLRRGYGLG